MSVSVQDNADRHRYELFVDGSLAGFADYRSRDGRVIVTHSEVDPSFRGQGLGSILARESLDGLRERGVRVVPSCPFFAKYVSEHPEYADLVDD